MREIQKIAPEIRYDPSLYERFASFLEEGTRQISATRDVMETRAEFQRSAATEEARIAAIRQQVYGEQGVVRQYLTRTAPVYGYLQRNLGWVVNRIGSLGYISEETIALQQGEEALKQARRRLGLAERFIDTPMYDESDIVQRREDLTRVREAVEGMRDQYEALRREQARPDTGQTAAAAQPGTHTESR